MTRDQEREKEFAAFYFANRHRLVRIVTAFSGDRHLAEDITQEVMINLRECWGRYQRPEILMVQMAKQELGRRRRRTAPEQMRSLDSQINEVDAKGQHPGADAGLEDFDRNSMIMKALRGLPTRQKEVIVLIVLCGLDQRTTAEILGISESAVSTHKRRGLARLEMLLADRSQTTGSGSGQAVGGGVA